MQTKYSIMMPWGGGGGGDVNGMPDVLGVYLCTCVCVHVCVYMCVCMCVCACMYTCVCRYMYMLCCTHLVPPVPEWAPLTGCVHVGQLGAGGPGHHRACTRWHGTQCSTVLQHRLQ